MFRSRLARRACTVCCSFAAHGALHSAVALAATPAFWTTAVTDDWHDASRWSTSPFYPTNGNPAGTTYDVNINATGPAYKIFFGLNPPALPPVTLDSFQLNSPDAQLEMYGSRLTTLNGFDINSGTVILSGATLSGAIGGTGGTLRITNSSGLDAVVLRRELLLSGAVSGDVTVTNGLTLDGGSVRYSSGFLNVRFDGTQTLSGTGTYEAGVSAIGTGTVTIAPNFTVRGAGTQASANIVNQGIIAPTLSYSQIYGGDASGSGRLYNDGLIEARPGTRVHLRGSFVNRNGLMRTDGGTLIIGSSDLGEPTYFTGTLGTIENNGGTIHFAGRFDNTGRTFAPTAQTGDIFIQGSTISGGTIANGAGQVIRSLGGNTFQNVTLASNLTVEPNNEGGGAPVQQVRDRLTLQNTTLTLNSPTQSGFLTFQGTTPVLDGTGTVIFNTLPPGSQVNQIIVSDPVGTVTIGSGITVRSGLGGIHINDDIAGKWINNAGTIVSETPGRGVRAFRFANTGTMSAINGGTMSFESTWNNAGTIAANGASTFLASGTWTNTGTIIATGTHVRFNTLTAAFGNITINGSTLTTNQSITSAQVSGIDFNNGTLQMLLGGTINNGSQTLAMDGLNILLNGGTLSGGTLTRLGSERIVARGSGVGSVVGIRTSVPLTVEGGTLRTTGVVLNNTQIDVGPALGQPNSRGTLTLQTLDAITGTGTINLLGGGQRNLVAFNATNGVTALGPNIVIQTAGGDATFTIVPDRFFLNAGTIIASNGRSIDVQGGTFTNGAFGHIRATNGGSFLFNGTMTINSGTMQILGSSAVTTARFSNSGTIVIDGSSILRSNGTFTNSVTTGTITTTGTIDVNNALIVDHANAPAQFAAIQSQIVSGRNGGAWDGVGITSSNARDASPSATTLGLLRASDYHAIFGAGALFEGQAVSDNALLVKYTYYGDTDLNGVVNFDDYARIDGGFNNGSTGWLNGDFDLNGVVNFDDYALIDVAFNSQNGPLRPLQAVPEPTVSLVTAISIIALARRRRVV